MSSQIVNSSRGNHVSRQLLDILSSSIIAHHDEGGQPQQKWAGVMLTEHQLQQLRNEKTPLQVQVRWIHQALGAYQRHEHHATWLGKGQRYFYQEERSLATWIEIEGDIIRSCLTDSSDGGSWGLDSRGSFCVTCFYYETTGACKPNCVTAHD